MRDRMVLCLLLPLVVLCSFGYDFARADIVVDSLTASDSVVIVGDFVTVEAYLVYGDATVPVMDGNVSINGYPARNKDDVTVGYEPMGVAVDESRGKAYVVNSAGNTVSVIDADTDTVTATIPVGGRPMGVAVDQSRGKAYVTNLMHDTVFVIDTGTDAVTATINVGSGPWGVAVDESRGKVYVVNSGSNTVSVIDTGTYAVIATILVGVGPRDVAVDQPSGKAYVTNLMENTVSVIETGTDTVIASIPVGDGPMGVAVDSFGCKAYVANSFGYAVSVIDTGTYTVMANITVGECPNAVAVDSSGGKAYVVNNWGNSVSVIETGTDIVTATILVGQLPKCVAVDESRGKAFVTSPESNGVCTVISDTWKIVDSKAVLQSVTYDTVTASGNSRGISTVDMNGQSTTVNWTGVVVASLTASDSVVFVGDLVTVEAYLVYGDTGFPVMDGNVAINGYPASNKDDIPVGDGPMGVAVDESRGKAYVTNSDDDTVSVIDTVTDTVIATIPAGGRPTGVAVDESRGKAYVTNFMPYDTVSVIDTDTYTVIGTIPVGFGPMGVAVDESRGKAYVTNSDWWTVSVIDTGTDTVTATITVGTAPMGVAVDESRGKAYVTNHYDDTVSVIDTGTDTVTATITVGTAPMGVAVDESRGKAYVTNHYDDTVSVIDTVTDTVTATITVGTNPEGVAVDESRGKAYVTNSDGWTVSVIDTVTDTVTATIPVGYRPENVAVDQSSGKAYVTNNGYDSCTVISDTWKLIDSKAVPQSVTYDTVTASGNSRGISTVDMNGQSTTVTWKLNTPPEAFNDTYSLDENTTLDASPGVLVNDVDEDGDPLTASMVSEPSDGALTLNPNGSFTYTPDPDFYGNDNFTYVANDGLADSNIATVSLTVNPVNEQENSTVTLLAETFSGAPLTGVRLSLNDTTYTTPDQATVEKEKIVLLAPRRTLSNLLVYEFNHWENGDGNNISKTRQLEHQLTGDATLAAVFRTRHVNVTINVNDELGDPLPLADVTLDRNMTLVTDVDGSVTFTGVPIGKHGVQVEHTMYRSITVKEKIRDDADLTYSMALKPMLHVEAALLDGTSLPGTVFKVDGVRYRTPADVRVSTRPKVVVRSQVIHDGTVYNFTRWEDGLGNTVSNLRAFRPTVTDDMTLIAVYS